MKFLNPYVTSVCAEEFSDHGLVGWLDVLWLVLVAVHNESHADSKHEHFSIADVFRVASLN